MKIDKHIRFRSDSDNDQEKANTQSDENEVAEEQQQQQQQPRFKKSPTRKDKQTYRTNQNGGNRKRPIGKEFDYSLLEALSGSPRVSEKIAFQVDFMFKNQK